MLDNLPEWAPPILVKIYRGESLEFYQSQTPLLERMISDPRMEYVWRKIIEFYDHEYPREVYAVISFVLSYEEPKFSIENMKKNM